MTQEDLANTRCFRKLIELIEKYVVPLNVARFPLHSCERIAFSLCTAVNGSRFPFAQMSTFYIARFPLHSCERSSFSLCIAVNGVRFPFERSAFSLCTAVSGARFPFPPTPWGVGIPMGSYHLSWPGPSIVANS